MRTTLTIAIATTLLVLMATSSLVAVTQDCREGTSPVTLTLPNGKTKTVCIPDEALPGLETAAENSSGVVEGVQCPCWPDGLDTFFGTAPTAPMCNVNSQEMSAWDDDRSPIDGVEAGKLRDPTCEGGTCRCLTTTGGVTTVIGGLSLAVVNACIIDIENWVITYIGGPPFAPTEGGVCNEL